MHNTLKCIFIIVITLLLSSCSSGNNMNIEISPVSYETDTYKINGENIKIPGDTATINELNTLFETEINDWTENFKSRVEISNIDPSNLPCLQMRHSIKENDDTLLSIVTEKYAYISGMHGNTWWSAKNYDVKNDKILNLSDLFVDDGYIKILNEQIKEIIRTNEKEYHDLWKTPELDKARENRFYISDGYLCIFYEPYELSYYAKGVVEFHIPIEKIRGYIKPEYLSSAKK